MALGEKKGKHVIVSRIEDFGVPHSARALEKQGFQVTYLDVDEYGHVDLDQLREAITPETILISVQAANQEIGTLQDVATSMAVWKTMARRPCWSPWEKSCWGCWPWPTRSRMTPWPPFAS